MTERRDLRFDVPLYTVAEAARLLDVPASTLATWAKGYERFPQRAKPVRGAPIITAVPASRLEPSIPFVGLVEGQVVAALRRAGVSLQHIRRAVDVLNDEIGVAHALASKRLYTDGARVLYDYAEREANDELAVVVTQQRVFAPVVREYLERITYGADGLATRVVVPMTQRRVVEVDPTRSFGQPIFIRGGIRVEDVVDRWKAGDALAAVAEDFGIPIEDVEDVLRASVPAAA
jgi:uncharacterized protein (DUF433 family)/DNA-binding transcriptional MerR regulator